MAGVNRVILLGHLGKDPEIRHLDTGIKVASFTLATTETFLKDGQRSEHTEWHNIVAWRGLAEIAEKFLVKGKQACIEGKLRTRSWDDKDGIKRYITEIVADNLVLLGAKAEHKAAGNDAPVDISVPAAHNPPAQFSNNTPDDDLPF